MTTCVRCSMRSAVQVVVVLIAASALLGADAKSRPETEIAAQDPAVGELTGTWLGALEVGVIKLRLGVMIRADADGRYRGTLTSIDQGNSTLPIDAITLEDGQVRLQIKRVQGVFEGACDKTQTALVGRWKQGAVDLPLTLKKVDRLPLIKRPQEPKKPYPYREEQVTFLNKKHDVKLAGTLTSPEGEGPFPAVVLISGSGPQNRDEELLGHRPFLVLADYLTRRGIAVLRFDDRGTGKSTGEFSAATSEDFAEDVWAGVQFLQSRPECDTARIGLVGHSEGGLIAPMLATRRRGIAFIVLIAGSGVPGDEIIQAQQESIQRAYGVDEARIEVSRKLNEQIAKVVKEEKDDELARSKSLAIISEWPEPERAGQTAESMKEDLESQLNVLLSPWFRYFLAYDPRPALRAVDCPVLAVFGEKDCQVAPKQNLHAVETALKQGGNEDFQVTELAGLNHLLQPCKTGLPDEYAFIEETIATDALKLIGDWIVDHTSR